MRPWMATIIIALVSTGCTHQQLRYSTIRQSETVTRIHEKQVLDNLAMFVKNPYAVPHFATAGEGSTGVDDSGSFATGPLNAFRVSIGLQGSRGVSESWTLVPMTNPHKLRLMRCAYQRAVGADDSTCQNCCKLETEFEGEEFDANNTNCCDACKVQCGWFHTSNSKWDVPRGCTQYGEYCGCYVWVSPEYQHEFAKLVMLILDYAIHDGHEGSTKTVTVKIMGIDQTATVPVELRPEQIQDLLNPPPDAETRIYDEQMFGPNWKARRDSIKTGPPLRSPDSFGGLRAFEQRRRALGLDRP